MKLKDRLAGRLAPQELTQLIGAYDVLGDIAVVTIGAGLIAREQEIAAAILAGNPRLKVVAKRAGHYGGEFRTMPLTILAGENRQETEVKEFGVRLLVNVATVYYSIRSGNERKRIAALVTPGESVLVLFSGIAPLPLMIARYSKAGAIVGIEKNPQAHAYALTNLARNKQPANIRLYQGDVREVVPRLAARFDRVLMPLPTGAEAFLPCALQALQKEGSLHFYDMQALDSLAGSVAKIDTACCAAQRKLNFFTVNRCGHCGPNTYRICVDAKIS